jgi:hypothetical protein
LTLELRKKIVEKFLARGFVPPDHMEQVGLLLALGDSPAVILAAVDEGLKKRGSDFCSMNYISVVLEKNRKRDLGPGCSIAKWCLEHDCGRLSEKQRAFLQSMVRYQRPSEKQMAWLGAIEKKLAQALPIKTDPDGPGSIIAIPSKAQRNVLEALHEGDKLEKVGRHYWLFGGPFGGGGFGIRPSTTESESRRRRGSESVIGVDSQGIIGGQDGAPGTEGH